MPPADAPDRLSLSALLRQTVDDFPGDRIGPAELADRLGDRALAGLLLIFALFNTLPLPPGTTFVTGVPLLLFSAQFVLGHTQPWLPPFIRKRTIKRAQLSAMLAKFLRFEHWIERLFRPRLLALVDGPATRVIGAVCFLLAIVVELPIPLGNQAPSLTIAMFMVAIIYRDGLAVLAGVALTVASSVLVSSMAVATFRLGLGLVERYLT